MTNATLQARLDRLVTLAHEGNGHAVPTLRQALAETTDEADRALVRRAIMEATDAA
jgi:hypothetical protein